MQVPLPATNLFAFAGASEMVYEKEGNHFFVGSLFPNYDGFMKSFTSLRKKKKIGILSIDKNEIGKLTLHPFFPDYKVD